MIQFWLQTINRPITINPLRLNLTLLLVISLYGVSCRNSTSDLGLNLRSDRGEIYSAATDTFTINAFTVREDSIKTDSLSTNILGAMNDPQFGFSTAGVATELSITQADISFGTAPKIDSVQLYLRFDKNTTYGNLYYGNLNSNQDITVYYLNEKIDVVKKYFSVYQPALGAEIGKWSGKFNVSDSVSIRNGSKFIKRGAGLLITLYKTVGQNFANASPSVYSNVTAFKDFLKGIVMVPQKNGLAPGNGGISAIDLFSGTSQLIVHYNDTFQHAFVMNSNCLNFNFYNKEFTNPDIINQLSKPKRHYNTTYVQSLGNCKTKIEIPHILNLVKDLTNERIILNEAALVITPLNGSVSTNYPLPVRLYLLQPNVTTNLNSPILDFIDFIDPTYGRYSIYGGSFNTLTGDYTIRFTRHLQYVLDNYLMSQENLNRGFFVTIPSDQPITPSRLIMDNTRLPNYKALKLRISYSKIKI